MVPYLVIISSLLNWSSPPNLPDCYDNTFCIDTIAAGDSVHVVVENLVSWDVTVQLEMHLRNMVTDAALPLVRSFPGKSKVRVLTLGVMERRKGWSFEFDLKWTTGSIDARHAPGHAYTLPYAKGAEYLVGQGFNGPSTHQGRNAIDWDMPEGTEVRAARGGIVVELEESHHRGGLDPALKSRANYVKIRHDDGTIANYVHLRRGGVRVQVGDLVRTGEFIAYSGNTGYTSGPHLHFEVYTLDRNLERKTIAVQFRSAGRAADVLREGYTYRH